MLFSALTALSMRLFQRAGLKLSTEQEAAYDAIIHRGIALAEEFAGKQIDGLKMTGDDKLALALKFVVSQIDVQGLEVRGEKWITDRIHAALGKSRNSTTSELMSNIMGLYNQILAPKPPIAEAVAEVPVAAPVAEAPKSA